MKNKFYNDAIIGNENILASFSKKGELLRFCYKNRDYRQFIDEFLKREEERKCEHQEKKF